jgi:hypothetical protein
MTYERFLKVVLLLLILTSCSTRYTITNKQQCKCILKYEYEMINKQDTITIQSNKLYNVGDKCNNKMKKIEVTQQEIWDATRPNVYKNKKKYTRKNKHKKGGENK